MTVQTLSRELSGFGLTWLVQSSVLLTLGLLAGWLFRRSGPAMQSCVYRTTLAAVLVCPFASAALGIAGFDGFSLRLPATTSQGPTLPVASVLSAAPEAIDVAIRSNSPVLRPREEASPAITASMPRAAATPSAPTRQ